MYRGAIRKASKKAAARFILRLFKAIAKGHVYQAAGHRPHGEQRAVVTGLGCNMGLDFDDTVDKQNPANTQLRLVRII